jgi:hypothetical protein
MTQIFQIFALSLNLNAAPAAAQFTTCDMPNGCGGQAVEAPKAQKSDKPFQTCQAPNTCSGKAAIVVAEKSDDKDDDIVFEPCIVGKCKGKAKRVELLVAGVQGLCNMPGSCFARLDERI